MDTATGADRVTATVAFLVREHHRGLEGTAPELHMIVHGRGVGELRANIASALRARFGRDQAFSMLVGFPHERRS